MIHLTPEILEAAYNLLRATPPFKGWKLPHSDDVEFHVTRHIDRSGDCTNTGKGFTVRISSKYHATLPAVLETMAHEMVHMRQHQFCFPVTHGPRFKRLAKQVCRRHGFSEAVF